MAAASAHGNLYPVQMSQHAHTQHACIAHMQLCTKRNTVSFIEYAVYEHTQGIKHVQILGELGGRLTFIFHLVI